ncbi:MAG: GNAT family N-acetyltransferase [Acidimicrobiales bacterium]
MGTIRAAVTGDDYAAFGTLVREYVASLPFVLDFQDYEGELAGLERVYGPPGGAALLAELDGSAVGCVGIMSLQPPATAELKRMYLQPTARGRGLGRSLAEAALATAARLGYEIVRLDTVAELEAANALYRSMGFVEIAPYRHNPLPTARFYEVALREAGSR